MISLLMAVVVTANDVIADPSNDKKNGTQKLGKQVGKFMNSFMEGLEEQENAKPTGDASSK
ncbi:MAG: hypothetical protein HQL68_12175, partial [Magnetococcales bacterium]|nr:hypothetical protein [Magnetococcales bacterium]